MPQQPLQPVQPSPRHLLIGYEHPFAIELSRALQLRDGPGQTEGTNDLDNLATFIGRWCPTNVYLLTALFPSTDAEHPATHWHRSTRQLLKVLYLARQYRFKLYYEELRSQSLAPRRPSLIAPTTRFKTHQRCPSASANACRTVVRAILPRVRSRHPPALRFPVIIRPSDKTATH